MAFHSNPLSMAALAKHVNNIADATTRGVAKAIIETTEMAYKDAVLNARKNFNNTPGRTRTGQLMNAIFRGYNKEKGEGFIGVRSPYGAIQEFGGTVVPKNAKHLWVKNYIGVDGQFKRWQPKDFMDAAEKDSSFFIFKNPHTKKLLAAHRKGPAAMEFLFSLVSKSTLPERPYIRPAVEAAYVLLSENIGRRIQEESENDSGK